MSPAPDPFGDSYTAWKQWQDERFASPSKLDAGYYAWHLARCHPAPITKAIEIGFGNGEFLGYARSKGIDVVGVEVQPELRRRAQAAGFRALASIDELDSSERFDLVAAFDVLEHVEAAELLPLVRGLGERLTPGGVLLCRVPNGESPFGRMHQHGDLTHRTTLGLSIFEQLAASTGMQISHHGDLPWYLGLRKRRHVLRGAMRRITERWIAYAYHWDSRRLSPNLVVALRRVAD